VKGDKARSLGTKEEVSRGGSDTVEEVSPDTTESSIEIISAARLSSKESCRISRCSRVIATEVASCVASNY
jgi:hypothetical protein